MLSTANLTVETIAGYVKTKTLGLNVLLAISRAEVDVEFVLEGDYTVNEESLGY